MSNNGDKALTAIDILRLYQKQLDPEGVLVCVSRQALDEVLNEIESLQAELAARDEVVEAATNPDIALALSIYKNGMTTGMIRVSSAERKTQVRDAITVLLEALRRIEK